MSTNKKRDRLSKVYIDELIEDGYRLIVDEVIFVGATYLAKIISPFGDVTQSLTKFRRSFNARKWASKKIRAIKKASETYRH